jgi:hypothetical protein
MSMAQVSHDTVLRLLKHEDDQVRDRLLALMHPLLAWGMLDEHDTSERGGIGPAHAFIDNRLAAALCAVVDELTQHTITTSAGKLADLIQAEVASETVAYRSHAKVRLMRLQSCIQGWLDDVPEDHEYLAAVTTELLLLCDHLGIVSAQCEAIEDPADVLRRRALRLLQAEDEAIHLVLASLATAVRRWIPFDDHDTSERQGQLADHQQAEQDLAGVLVQLITRVCQPDQLEQREVPQ